MVVLFTNISASAVGVTVLLRSPPPASGADKGPSECYLLPSESTLIAHTCNPHLHKSIWPNLLHRHRSHSPPKCLQFTHSPADEKQSNAACRRECHTSCCLHLAHYSNPHGWLMQSPGGGVFFPPNSRVHLLHPAISHQGEASEVTPCIYFWKRGDSFLGKKKEKKKRKTRFGCLPGRRTCIFWVPPLVTPFTPVQPHQTSDPAS